MSPSSLPEDIRQMSIPARLELVAAIWDSVAEDTQTIELTEAQRQELDRRLANREANPDDKVPWETAKQKILSEL